MSRDYLLDICSIPSPSGYEDSLINYILNYSKKNHSQVKAVLDSGELYMVRQSNDPNNPTIFLDAHIDQVSFRVYRITPEGFLICKGFGVDVKDVIGHSVQIFTNAGIIDGVSVFYPPHLEQKLDEIIIDPLGKKAEIGDPVFFPCHPRIHGDFIIGGGLDNHLGVYTLLRFADHIDSLAGVDYNVIIHMSRKEEVGGLKYIHILDDYPELIPKRIDLMIILDTEIAFDYPRLNTDQFPDISLGSGPVLTRNLTDNHQVFKFFKSLQDSKYQVAMSDIAQAGNNLADYNRLSSLGQSIGIPLRYMHSPVEVARLSDIEDTLRLLQTCFENLDSFFHPMRNK